MKKMKYPFHLCKEGGNGMNMEMIIEKQRKFYKTNKTKVLQFRLQALELLEKAVIKYEEELESALYQDLKKSKTESFMTEISLVLSEIRYIKKHLKKWDKDVWVRPSLMQFPSKGIVVREPYGCALIIAPWNYPVLLTLQPLIGAIAGGNCAILKPSEYAPYTSKVLKKLIKSVFSEHYICVIEGDVAVSQQLLKQRFDFIFYTGGERVGKIVLKESAEYLTPTILELGGKSPCIVTKTANISYAAKRIVFGKFLNSGQTCVAPDYVLVEEEVKEELVGKIKQYIKKFYGNDPLQSKTYSAIINVGHYNRLLALLKDANKNPVCNEETLQIAPTIIEDATEEMAVMKEEIFGPILPILSVKSLEEAKEFVEKREKPLALYLFTGDQKEGRKQMKQLSYGGGCINDTILHLAGERLPFGGVGNSGMGSYHGKYSYEAFTREKGILESSSWFDVPLRYPPYTTRKGKMLKKFLDKI